MTHDDTQGIRPNAPGDSQASTQTGTQTGTQANRPARPRAGRQRSTERWRRRPSPEYFRDGTRPSSIAEQDPGFTRFGKPAPGAAPPAGRAARGSCAARARSLARRRSCERRNEDNEPAYLPLSRTTDRVLRIMLDGDLTRVRAEKIADTLGISGTTLRRRLRDDHTSYQFLLDRARQYRCEALLRGRWLPGRYMAEELGYLEVNSFYRAFRRWTGLNYSAYKEARL